MSNNSNQIPPKNTNNLTSSQSEPTKPPEASVDEQITAVIIMAIIYFLVICAPVYLISKLFGDLTFFHILCALGFIVPLFTIISITSNDSKKEVVRKKPQNEKKERKEVAKCKKCGKGGFFHPVNSNGLCISCVTSELNTVSEEMKELSDKLNETQAALKKAESNLLPEVIKYSRDCDKIKELEEKQEALKNDISDLQQKYSEKKQELQEKTAQEIEQSNATIRNLQNKIKVLEGQQIVLDEAVLLQSFGLYEPQYDFENSEKYKLMLDKVREKQKSFIKTGQAIIGSENWTIDGDTKKGAKMVGDMKKLLLKAYNEECDELVRKVKYNNFEAYKKRIETSCNQISKLGTMLKISISNEYMQLKINELTIAFEYAQMKQKEKEEQKVLREQMREEAKLLKEIEEERKKLQKEQNHYANALEKVEAQLRSNPDDPDLLAKKRELEEQAAEIEKAIKDVDYREANKRAGYVYIISNIGAFGENIYKIGMTRRLDPQERIDELGGASVPFKFDVHALIFTEDAPALEAALHRAFENKKVNMVNQRREFFNVTLDEIKAVIKENYDKTVEFVDIPEAEQYRISTKMKNSNL